MKVLFLLPPSEGKKFENTYKQETLSFNFKKPLGIAHNVTEKDLKCSGKRFEEGLKLNKNIKNSETIEAINRYSGVMFNAIDYAGMNDSGKTFFEKHFLILSGMYGIVKPLDIIGDYKLPIEAKGLLDFWGDEIIREINSLKVDYVVNLLPISYAKLILGKNKKIQEEFNELRKFKVINVNFLKSDGKKISHGVKKIKGEWIKCISEKAVVNYNDFGGEVVELEDGIVDINICINKCLPVKKHK